MKGETLLNLLSHLQAFESDRIQIAVQKAKAEREAEENKNAKKEEKGEEK